jgi:hypothetical protein
MSLMLRCVLVVIVMVAGVAGSSTLGAADRCVYFEQRPQHHDVWRGKPSQPRV